jgi:hypothetical protein
MGFNKVVDSVGSARFLRATEFLDLAFLLQSLWLAAGLVRTKKRPSDEANGPRR